MLIDVVRKAAAEAQKRSGNAEAELLDNPSVIHLNGNASLRESFAQIQQPPRDRNGPLSLLTKISPWNLNSTDQKISESQSGLLKILKNDPNPQSNDATAFLNLLQPPLADIAAKLELQVTDKSNPLDLIRVCAPFLGSHVVNTIIKRCVSARIWEVLAFLLPCQAVSWNIHGDLISSLVECRRADLLCLCFTHIPEIRPSDLLLIFRYYLGVSQDEAMKTVKQEWKNQGLMAIGLLKDSDKKQKPKKSANKGLVSFSPAEHTAILLAMAHDEFSPAETCLHFLVSFLPDETVMSMLINSLDTKEVLKLLKYLQKWLIKYSKSLISGPLPAHVFPEIKMEKWVPSLATILQWTGLMLDKKFSIMVICPEFHHELRFLKKLVHSFVKLVSIQSTLVPLIELGRSSIQIHGVNDPEEDGLVEFLDID